jgi:Bacterial protein of unknown function (DUF903)
MHRLSHSLLFALTLALVCSCGSGGSYRLTLRDGREFIAASRPEMQRKTGYYRYRTYQGRDALIRAEEVILIERES